MCRGGGEAHCRAAEVNCAKCGAHRKGISGLTPKNYGMVKSTRGEYNATIMGQSHRISTGTKQYRMLCSDCVRELK